MASLKQNQNKIYSCQVDNVSRFLRYVQPTGDEPTLDFLQKTIETRDYFVKLEATAMSPATILNYMKNIIRFLDYLKTRVDLESSNPELRHRWDTFVGGMKSVRKCQEILQVAKKDFLNLYGKLITNQPITENEKTMYGYYLEAVMVFQHFQRPGAVEGMTVDEFVNRKECNGRVVVGIKQHKTATMQVAALALTLEEDAWFEAYYQHIRTRHETVSCQSFFIGSTGAAVHKVTNDIRRLQDMYKVDRSTSQEVRRAAETQAAKNFTPAQKEKVARYMAHTTQVAEAHYRMMLPEQTAETAELMMVLNDLSPDNSDGRGNLPEKVLPKRQFSTFLENFPVTLDGSAPPAKKRKEAGFPAEDRSLTDKWHKIQRDHRAEYLLSKFRHRQPTQRQFDRCVEGMKWETNKPKYPTVLKLWTPPHKEDIASNKQLIRSVMTQRWKGLSIKDFGGDKGKGVIADRRFVKGEIVCDYHGNVIQASEGRTMLGAHEDGGSDSALVSLKTSSGPGCVAQYRKTTRSASPCEGEKKE